MVKPIIRLEQALKLWEDGCFFYSNLVLLARNLPSNVSISCPDGMIRSELHQLNIGPVANWRSLRKYLLQSISGDEVFDFDRYISTKRVRDLLGANAWLPLILWSWTRNSRMVYQLSRELQLLLSVTSLERVTWGDLRLPFDSFAITLTDPIVDEQSGESYDLIVVSKLARDNDQSTWTDLDFTLFPVELGLYKSSTAKERGRVEKMVAGGDWNSLARWIGKFQSKLGTRRLLGFNFSYGNNLNAPIVDDRWEVEEVSPSRVGGEPDRPEDLLCLHMKTSRVVAGLMLYLRSLPPGHSCIEKERMTAKEARERVRCYDKYCITNEAHICTVSSTFKLTAAEKRALDSSRAGAGGYQVRAHFRSGHWRRPPGSGDDLLAEKTVWVRPTLVRRDRLAQDSVPGGSEAIL